MGSLIDLTGQKFGRLKVLSYKGNRVWECKCDCGEIKSFRSSVIKKATSCGCDRYINKKPMTEEHKKHIGEGLKKSENRKTFHKSPCNLVGQRFGKLVVLEETDMRKGTNVIWKCQCDCGNITYAITSSLNKGDTKSYHLDGYSYPLRKKR